MREHLHANPHCARSTVRLGQADRRHTTEAIPRPDSDGKRVNFARIAIYSSRQSDPIDVCLDTGCGPIIAAKDWLQTNFPNAKVFKRSSPMPMRGVGSTWTVTEQAAFTFLLSGNLGQQEKVFFKFSVTADLVPSLGPGILLGSSFLWLYGGVVDYIKSELRLRAAQNLAVPVQVLVNKVTTSRPVYAAGTVQVIKGQSQMPVRVKSFGQQNASLHALISCHYGVQSNILDDYFCSSLRTVKSAPENFRIRKGDLIGHVRTIQPQDWDRIYSQSNGRCAQPDNEKYFGIYHGEARDLQSRELKSWEDAAYFLHCKHADKEELFQPTHEEIDRAESRPEFATPEYGFSRPKKDENTIRSTAGACISNKDPKFAAQMKALVDRFDIFSSRGLVPLPDDMKLKVQLVEGWQNQISRIRAISLGTRERAVLDQTHDQLHAEGKLEFAQGEVPIACPAFIVKRPNEDGTTKYRVVVDMRPLNRVILPDVYPLPNQEEIIEALRGHKYKTVFDAIKFFFQLPVHAESRKFMAIISPRGIEVSNVALMGYKTSPAFAQRTMEWIFRECKDFVRVYIDDIVIYSKDAESHLKHLEIFFEICMRWNLVFGAPKSFMGFETVRLLGWLVDANGVRKTQDRLRAMAILKCPQNLADLEKFLGMESLLRKGISWYDVRNAPLQDLKVELNKKGRELGLLLPNVPKGLRERNAMKLTFEPTSEQLDCFKELQNWLCSDHLLVHHDPSKELFYKVDACPIGYGLMVFQLDIPWDQVSIPGKTLAAKHVQPIFFLSRRTSKTERSYGSTESEISALTWAVRKTHRLLASTRLPVQVLTDHSATKGIVLQTSLATVDLNKANPRLAHAAIFLSSYNLRIWHIEGKLNIVPDALSRLLTYFPPTPDDVQGPSELDNIGAHLGEENSQSGTEQSRDESTINTGQREPPMRGVSFDHFMLDGWAFENSNRHRAGYFRVQASDETEQMLQQEYQKDPSTAKIIAAILDRRAQGTPSPGRPKLPIGPWLLDHQQRLYHVKPDKSLALVIPSEAVKTVLEHLHDNRMHFKRDRMLHDAKDLAFKNKLTHIDRYLRHCNVCQKNEI